jgi:hypothetical protein
LPSKRNCLEGARKGVLLISTVCHQHVAIEFTLITRFEMVIFQLAIFSFTKEHIGYSSQTKRSSAHPGEPRNIPRCMELVRIPQDIKDRMI